VLLGLTATPPTSARSHADRAAQPADRVLVKFRPGVAAATAAGVIHDAGAAQRSVIGRLGVHVLVASNGRAGALRALRASPAVEYAEPDVLAKPMESLPSDPYFPQQLSPGSGAWGWFKTRTTQAWDITQGDPGVVVAVIDTGLHNLPDFAGQTVAGWDVVRGSSDTSSTAGNHGTYVAGVAGLSRDNGMGNAGYCPGCRIMPVQVGSDSGAYTSDIAAGVTWAADHGARVENLSWAATSSSSTLASAVSYAQSRNVVVVAAAGNGNCDCPTYPAAIPGVIAVAGTTSTDAKQGDSNFGSWVTLAAPESNMTAWPVVNGAPGFAPVGGTSLAAPVVAGLAGLLISYNPSLTATQVTQALEATAVPVPFAVQYGRVDALAALASLGASDPQPAVAPVNATSPQILLETNGDQDSIPLTRAPQSGDVLFRGQGGWTGAAPLTLSALKWQRCDAGGASCTTVGTSYKYTVQSADAGYAFRLLVTVKNGLASTTATSALSAAVGGATQTPSPPTSTAPPVVTGTAQDGQVLSASTGTWSNSPTSYAYQWQRCDAGGAGCSPVTGATGQTYALTSTDVGATIAVSVTATNAAGSGVASSAPTAVVTAAASASPPPATTTTTFSGSLSAKTTSRSFTVRVGAGAAGARLSFSKCASLTLSLRKADSTNLASASGPSVLALDQTLAAGSYVYAVSGGRCSFTLTVTAAS
jgi:thermitase